jgi:hypothetical protein
VARRPREVGEALQAILAAQQARLAQAVKAGGGKPTAAQQRAIESLAAEALQTAGRLNRLNRVVREALESVAATEGARVLPFRPESAPGAADFVALLGTTIHAGEQVATRPIADLLGDIEVALNSGTDRIGHAVVLGLEINGETLAKLGKPGFTWDAKAGEDGQGRWVRGEEAYSAADLARMEATRKRLLARVAAEGVVIEVPPTSNIVLNNLGIADHPVSRMLRDSPGPPAAPLRVAVATDNPGVHNVDVRSETALLLATGAITWPQAVRMTLEGFSARMGGRPIGAADALATRMADGLTASTRGIAAREAVLAELARRYPDAAPPPGQPTPDLSNDAVFREILRRFIERATQGRVAAKPAP